MKIGLYDLEFKSSGKSHLNNFIVETFLFLATQNLQHNFLLITENELSLKVDISSNTEVVLLKPRTGLLAKAKRNLELKQILKRSKLDLLTVAAIKISLLISIPHCIIVTNAKEIKPGSLKNADAIIVFNKKEKELLVERHKLPGEKIFLIYPSGNKIFAPIDLDEKQEIKAKYSDGKEYFLYNSNLNNSDELIALLKSFSHFKKRQQSNFKLLITGESNVDFDSKLADYKYRNDINFSGSGNEERIIAAAYAVVLPFNKNADIIAALNAMQSGVPVIASKDSIVNEIGNDIILQAETNSIKDMADKMMHIYTNENDRSALIQKGKANVQNFTREKAANDLWQVFLKALN